MTILAILALLFGIFLVFDGAFNPGLLGVALRNAGETTVAVVRIAEVITGGIIFVLLGFGFSSC